MFNKKQLSNYCLVEHIVFYLLQVYYNKLMSNLSITIHMFFKT